MAKVPDYVGLEKLIEGGTPEEIKESMISNIQEIIRGIPGNPCTFYHPDDKLAEQINDRVDTHNVIVDILRCNGKKLTKIYETIPNTNSQEKKKVSQFIVDFINYGYLSYFGDTYPNCSGYERFKARPRGILKLLETGELVDYDLEEKHRLIANTNGYDDKSFG